MEMIPKWILRWVERWEQKFPECAIGCTFDPEFEGYIVKAYFPKHQAWKVFGNWGMWATVIEPSYSPAVRQNRLRVRNHIDFTLRQEINRVKKTIIREDGHLRESIKFHVRMVTIRENIKLFGISSVE